MGILTINNAACNIVIYPVNYGLLYNWYTIDDARGLTSSDDWSVPTEAQWDAFILYLDPLYTSSSIPAAVAMKEAGTTHWTYDNGLNTSGFFAVGSGGRKAAGAFQSIKTSSYFWASDEYNATRGTVMNIVDANPNPLVATATGGNLKYYGQPICLIKDATGLVDGVTTTYTGNDGKIYTAIVINEIYYTVRNLVETKYRNGDWIPGYDAGVYTPIADATWATLTTGALCAYDDDWNNA